MTSNLVWFILSDSDTGQSYKGTTASSLIRSSIPYSLVADFRKAVKADKSSLLAGIDSSQLLVYKNKSAFDNRNTDEGKQEPLEEDSCINNLGTSKKDALIVVVQSSLITSLPTGSHTQNSMASHPRDKAITDNNLKLLLQNDVNKFLDYMIKQLAPFDPMKPYHANFLDNCLEYRLDRQHTSYTLDDINNIKVLISRSGSGKTRQLLELLHNQFGYFFTYNQTSDFGSHDIRLCMEIANHHPIKVDSFIKLLYFVRAYVCSYLFDLGYNTPAQILLAQLHPVSFFGCDLFAILFDSIARHTDIHIFIRIRDEGIKHLFDFVVIDQVQETMLGKPVFDMMSREDYPFLSPLVYYSKILGTFPKFIISGKGINFWYLKVISSSCGTVCKDVITMYDVISDLKPLDMSRAELYVRQMLGDHNIDDGIVHEVVDLVCCNPLFLGRARFISFFLDQILGGKTLDSAIQLFVKAVSHPSRFKFPLRFYRENLNKNLNSIGPVVKKDNSDEIIQQGFIQYLMTGKTTLGVEYQYSADIVNYGIGFCNVYDGMIYSVEMDELAVIECLRYLIPVSSLVPKICFQLLSCPKPHMLGYILEYLVGYALVAGLSLDNANNLKSTEGDFLAYLNSNDETEILFPDHLCGPDIVYKYQETVYIVQVKFVDKISKQERLNACHTTDPKRFYWNKKHGDVMVGLEENQRAILAKLEMFECRRVVFLHTTTSITDEMENVEIINQVSSPHFFDQVDPKLWDLLNKVRDNFTQ